MKQEFDKQIDSLLRGTRARASEGRTAPNAAAHLSADELSAYAENALPPATRARYTAHLADCADCRRIIVGVALAAGTASAREARAARPSTVKKASAWHERLAAFFSPQVLRYAVPVLAVALIAVLALVVIRRQPASDSQVAQQSPAEAERHAPIVREGETGATEGSSSAGTAAATQGGTIGTATNPSSGISTGAGAPGAPPAKENQATEKVGPKDLAVDSTALSETVTVTEDMPKAAAPPAAASVENDPRNLAPSAPLPINARRVQSEELTVQNQKPAPEGAKPAREESERRAADESKQAGLTAGGRAEAGSASRKSQTAPRRDDGEFATAKRNRAGAAKESDDEETRTVAGRRFRREGGVWIDVDYRSSMDADYVRRDSERFRSLAADIPEIGRIAEQLQGTVIVVARGRAYRIY